MKVNVQKRFLVTFQFSQVAILIQMIKEEKLQLLIITLYSKDNC